MRVKLYRAAGMSAAMALVRAELGPEAMILGTRRVAEGIEITAALEIAEADTPDIDGGGGHDSTMLAPGRATRAAIQPYPEVIEDGDALPARAPAWPAASRPRDPDMTARLFRPMDASTTDGQAPGERNQSGLPSQSAERTFGMNGLSGVSGGSAASARLQPDAAPALAPRPRLERAPEPWRPPNRGADRSMPTRAVQPAAGTATTAARSRAVALPGAIATGHSATRRALTAPDGSRRPGVTRMDDDAAQPSLPDERALPLARAGENETMRRAAALAWHGVPSAIASRLSGGPLAFALSIALPFAALDLEPGGPPLLLAGPPGAGKTLTTARLATRLVLAGCKPLVVTADGRRAGATEQLAAFTRLLGLHLLVASTPAALQRALARRVDGEPVLIDAPGIDPFVPSQIEELATLAASVAAVTALVCPAGLDANEAADIAAIHRAHGATLLVANRLDTGRRLGGVLAAAGAGLALTEAGIGPGASDGLITLTPQILAARLITIPDSSA